MKDIIESAFEDRANINPQSASDEVKQAVSDAIQLLDSGQERVAERRGVGDWIV
ncbi:MAG TPA: 2,3,4,5-tetrahydropyridine-2,6-dicarboxylate N-succinyltransferase, partial [Gammaproteobacteria bacterium]|nr:2,3,4,5-tetrahydropyridine-2,6-dicarboxylate N-succinyltransferase [Gammaproteobacteria bacterium]